MPTAKNLFPRCSENPTLPDLKREMLCQELAGPGDVAGMTVRERVEQLYETERRNIYSYVLYLGLPAANAQELTQDAFLKLYVTLSEGKSVENPRAWLYRVAHNLAIRSHTRGLRFDELDPGTALADAQPDPETTLIEKRRDAALRDAIRQLSPRQQNCLHLRVQGLGYREIADVIGISTSAVGEFLRRATERLKEALK